MSDEEFNHLDVPDYIMKCPIVFDWCYHKDNKVFASLNYEESIKAGRSMLDIHYCATAALNNIVEQTVPYNKKHFKLLKD